MKRMYKLVLVALIIPAGFAWSGNAAAQSTPIADDLLEFIGVVKSGQYLYKMYQDCQTFPFDRKLRVRAAKTFLEKGVDIWAVDPNDKEEYAAVIAAISDCQAGFNAPLMTLCDLETCGWLVLDAWEASFDSTELPADIKYQLRTLGKLLDRVVVLQSTAISRIARCAVALAGMRRLAGRMEAPAAGAADEETQGSWDAAREEWADYVLSVDPGEEAARRQYLFHHPVQTTSTLVTIIDDYVSLVFELNEREYWLEELAEPEALTHMDNQRLDQFKSAIRAPWITMADLIFQTYLMLHQANLQLDDESKLELAEFYDAALAVNELAGVMNEVAIIIEKLQLYERWLENKAEEEEEPAAAAPPLRKRRR